MLTDLKHILSKFEFSKLLLLQESLLMWVVTISCLILAYISITNDFTGELPWLAAIVGCPWTAYGVSQVYYYKKAMAENTKNGIKFETALLDYEEDLSLDSEN